VYFTAEGQRGVIQEVLERHDQGSALPHVILDEAEAVVGRITLSGIVRGPFLSCIVGYWVSEGHNGRGLASAAVAEIKQIAFSTLGLHRVQAETLIHNHASQVVLGRNDFAQIGLAPQYLNIAGQWQDHLLFQTINPALGDRTGETKPA
jgi:ribosomal-protein-alanine N-acetyltransferase